MRKMETSSILIGASTIVGIAFVIWILLHKKDPRPKIEEESAEGEIAFDDMVAYFKSLNLKREDGICAIVSDRNKIFHKLLYKEGYISLGLFVFNEKTNKIVKGKIVHAKGFDAKTNEHFNGTDIIKLA